jgi:hypothetical protein
VRLEAKPSLHGAKLATWAGVAQRKKAMMNFIFGTLMVMMNDDDDDDADGEMATNYDLESYSSN